MKKRLIKKYIPRDTELCGNCKNKVFSHKMKDEIRLPKELESSKYRYSPCKVCVYRCRYNGVLTSDDFLFDEGFKCCAIGEPNYYK